MLRYSSDKQLTIEGFKTPFDVHLNPENKWVKLANVIPWDEFIAIYSRSMSKTRGRPSISPRLAVSALIIKHMERLDDRGVVAALEENIYLQYFAGYPSFTTRTPFDPSLLVEMRARMGSKAFDDMSVIIITKAKSLIEDITSKNASKGKKGRGNKFETKKNNFENNGNDNNSLNSNRQDNQKGNVDSSADLKSVEQLRVENVDATSNPGTENTSQIVQNTVNVDKGIVPIESVDEINKALPRIRAS